MTVRSRGMAVGTGEMPKPQKEGHLVTDWLRGKIYVGKKSELVPWFLAGVTLFMVTPHNLIELTCRRDGFFPTPWGGAVQRGGQWVP